MDPTEKWDYLLSTTEGGGGILLCFRSKTSSLEEDVNAEAFCI